MPTYLLTIEYNGADFHGFQKQPGLSTIQGAIETVIMKLSGKEVRIQGAGRTDAGAHAIGQRAAFSVADEWEVEKTILSMNAMLPAGIAVSRMTMVEDGFDPRRAALWREYRYFIFNRREPSPILGGLTYHFPRELDLDLMKKACGPVLGVHDFSSFKAKSAEESFVREVLLCDLQEIKPQLICFRIKANSFLYRMVRMLASALVDVGRGRMTLDEFSSNLENPAERPCADPLPAHGLFLWRVAYPHELS